MTLLTFLAQDAESGGSLLKIVLAGGAVGYFIIFLSIVALTLVVAHAIHIRTSVLAPDDLVDRLHGTLASGDLAGAQKLCADPDEDCFLTRVMSAGFKRMSNSAFGSLELKGALEDAGKEQVARLYRTTDGLGLIAAIAPMLGLLGTVVGMVGAFNTISSTEGFARPDQLAGDISQALVTTLMGLILAIPATAAFTFFRNRIDHLATEVGSIVEDLAALAERAEANPAPNSAPNSTSAPSAQATPQPARTPGA